MRKISLILSFFIAFALAMQCAWAQEQPTITVEPIDDSIDLNEIAEYKIIFDNPTTKIFEYRFSTPDSIKWSIYAKPISDYIVKLYPKKQVNVTFHVDPLYIDNSGQYVLRFDFLEVGTGTTISKNVLVEILGEGDPQEYLPSFKFKMGVPASVDPRNDLQVSINITNLVPLEMENVEVLIDGSTFNPVSKSVLVESLGYKEMYFNIELDERTPPQNDTVTATVSYKYPANNRTYLRPPTKQPLKILEYSEVDIGVEKDKGFLSSTAVYNVHNDGNVKTVEKVHIPYNWFKSIFTSMERELPKVQDGQTHYEWKAELAPGETQHFRTATNYRPLLYILIVITLLIVAYYTFRSPILIEKSAAHISKKGDEGISEIKIKLHIKNRTPANFENVKLIDKIPKIADLASSFHVGTIKPNKILKHASKSTFLTWEIAALEGFEERIITYKINSRLKIIGGVRLPAALIKFRSRRLGRIKVESNSVLLRE